jgi:basic membrane protein A
VLTSALKGVDTAVFLTAKAEQAGTFKGGGNVVFGLDQNGVGLGKFSPRANKADIAATKRVARKIAAGQITDIPTTLK